MSTNDPVPGSLRTGLKEMWAAGDYGRVAEQTQEEAEEFIARLAPAPGSSLLDVACGSGNLTIPAARAGAIVTGVDFAPSLLEQARARAEAAGLSMQFDEGDAEELPYPDGTLDVVVSMFGAMFAPRPERVAAELMRVCRPGGRIAMANWTPEGFAGQTFRLGGRYVPPPPDVPPPVLWGDEATVRARLSEGVADLRLTRRRFLLKFPFPPAEVVEFYRAHFGPTQRTFESLDADRQAALRDDLERMWAEHNRASDGTTQIEVEYLEVIATKAGH